MSIYFADITVSLKFSQLSLISVSEAALRSFSFWPSSSTRAYIVHCKAIFSEKNTNTKEDEDATDDKNDRT